MARRAADAGDDPPVAPLNCERCGESLDGLHVCPGCGYHGVITAWERIEQLVDRNSFHETERHLWSGDPLVFSDSVSYERRVALAQKATNLLDAVVTGRARLARIDVVLIVFDFRFLGGSMGSVVGEKVCRAFDIARRENRPVIAICASGGARIQEGMLALFQMARTSMAAARLRERGVPLVSVLTDPTMGGVLASFSNLADVILAEPGALVAFVGPRVHEQAERTEAPPGSSEFALAHGLIDAVIERTRLRPALASLVGILHASQVNEPKPALTGVVSPGHVRRSVWETVELARRPDRPSGRAIAPRVFSDIVELHGDREGTDDDTIMAGVGRLGGRAVAFVAQDRHGPGAGHTRPGGYRKAQRAFTIAERFHLPLITMVDTPGAATDAAAEALGITGAIAESLARLARLRTPIINVVLGEGGSGGALALSVGDRLLMLEHAIFSVIGPEAASAILYHDATHAEELAGRLKLTAADLMALHLVDRIVPEQQPAHEAPDAIAAVLGQALRKDLGSLIDSSIKDLLRRREERIRHVRDIRGRLSLFVRNHRPASAESAVDS
ncbi:MAG TPA: carboxyl transferase domain-containing protein [Candidatus Dormibacteraeota bacterium]|nr:carboxyl transferase domain-containing protein [Candidatus Dormibacteraeota bacterium]